MAHETAMDVTYIDISTRTTTSKQRFKNLTVTTYYEPTLSDQIPPTVHACASPPIWPQGDQASATKTITFLDENWQYFVSFRKL